MSVPVMPVGRIAVPLTIGIAVGFLIGRNWPRIKEVSGPAVRGTFRKGREVVASQKERFDDLIAEIREEEAAAVGTAAAAAGTASVGTAADKPGP